MRQIKIVVRQDKKLKTAFRIPGIKGEGVPPGGTAGQVLQKHSDSDYDTEWVDNGGGSGSQYQNPQPSIVPVGGIPAGTGSGGGWGGATRIVDVSTSADILFANGGGSGGRGINGSIAAGGGIDVGLGLYNCPGGASSSAGTGMGTQNLVNGGSAGGGITTANVPGPGAAINSPFHPNLAGGFIPSAPSLVGRNGNPGATTAPSYRGPGQGGSGAGACIDTGYHGGTGGNGGFPGGGGGGGGAKRVDNSPSVRSGAGGNGAAGFVRIIVL